MSHGDSNNDDPLRTFSDKHGINLLTGTCHL